MVALTDQVRLERGGEQWTVVARRHRDPRFTWLPQIEFERLAALRSQGLLVPEPLLADTGGLLGMPALVVERLPGAPVIAPPDPYQWARLMAETLADIHAVDATSIPHVHDVRGQASIPDQWKRKVRAHPRGKEVLQRLAQFRPHTTTTPGLIHADYQSTNVIWSDGRISGVVDWVMPCYGSVEVDLAEARIDALLLFGPDVADAMRASYEDATGRGVAQMTSWDLFAVMGVGLAVGVKSWSARYRRLGRLDLTADVLSGRLDEWIERLLA